MEKQAYNDQMIIQYLLGSLPEEETERLDELSFIDDEFAERLDAVETDLVDAYVKGELSDQTLSRFDSYYLTSPKRREKVGFAQALQTIAEKAVTTGQVVFEQEPPPATAASDKSFSLWTFLSNFFTLPRLASAAAAMLTLAVGVWLAYELSGLRSQVDQAQARHNMQEQREKDLREKLEQQQQASLGIEKELERVREEKDQLKRQVAMERQIAKLQPSALPSNPNIVSFKLAVPTRSLAQMVGANLPQLRENQLTRTLGPIPPGTDYVALQLELQPDDYPGYRAALLTQSGRKPAGWNRERLRSRAIGGSKVIDISIPVSLLKSQEYILEVTGISNSGEAGDPRYYPFRIVKQ